MKKLIHILTILFCALVFGQQLPEEARTCGTMDVLEEQLNNPVYRNAYENAQRRVREAIIERRNNLIQDRLNGEVVTIPVVFHIIHNGEPEGEGTNLPKELIEAQLEQLNLDFRALNPDVIDVPDEFAGLISDIKVEFCLAAQDPNGIPTRGINRYNYGQVNYDRTDFDNTIKPETIWDRDKYLNIWTGRLNTYLGYAQLPIGGNANTDGVVVRDTSVGSVANPHPIGQTFNKGRTATHEIGHWLFLYHIWGNDNGGCDGTDLVEDTPNQDRSYSARPSYPQVSCESSDMFMNFMDYVYDDAMHMFSEGQKERIDATLSTTRSSLLTSIGCVSLDDFLISSPVTEMELCLGQEAQFDVNLEWVAFFEEEVTFSLINSPPSANFAFSSNSLTSPGSVILNVTNTESLMPGNYDITVNATDGIETKSLVLTLNVVDTITETPNAVLPSAMETIEINSQFNWTAVTYGSAYTIEIATDENFNDIIQTHSVLETSIDITNLNYDTQYFWRVKAINVCSESAYSEVISFYTTIKPICSDLMIDGSFEDSTSPNSNWIESSRRGLSLIGTSNPSEGFNGAVLGGGSREVSIIYQTVTIPSDAVLVKLTFDYAINSSQGSCAGDYAGVAIRREGYSDFSNGIFDFNLCSQTSTVGNYNTTCVDLSQFIGETIELGFYAVNDWYNHSLFYVDKVQLTVCDDAALEIPTDTNNYVADYEVTTLDGWTHYIDDNNTPCNFLDDLRLLSVEKQGQDIGNVEDNDFSVILNSNPTASQISTTYNHQADDYFAMNRYWEFNPSQQPNANLKVKHYYTQEDFNALIAINSDPIESREELIAYKINDITTSWDLDPINGHNSIIAANAYDADGWWAYSYGTPSINAYQYTKFPSAIAGPYEAVEYEVGHLGAGGLAVKNSYAISGNVFYDADALTDGIVDGYHITPKPELFVALKNTSNQIIDYIALGERNTPNEGLFQFYNIKKDKNYKVYLSYVEPDVGDIALEANLPLYYFFTGENIGLDPGSDGEIDGSSSEFFLEKDLENVNFGIIYFRTSTTP